MLAHFDAPFCFTSRTEESLHWLFHAGYTGDRPVASCPFTGMRDKNSLHSYVHVLALSLNSVQCSLKCSCMLSNGV